ncbi:hypothetical protein [Streptomyces sp. NPDC001401]|uniref:hypothetical protein n=1 Tax=Streptomyces sp. NPDC001401 TaxID=3364570 RepID=UPI0036824006
MTELSDVHADAMAYVCAHRDTLREELHRIGAGDEQVLDRLLAEAAAGTDAWPPLLDQLNEAILADGDALGLFGRGTQGTATRELRPAGIAVTPVSEVVYVCPATRCSRYWWPDAGAQTPECAVDGEPLLRARL